MHNLVFSNCKQTCQFPPDAGLSVLVWKKAYVFGVTEFLPGVEQSALAVQTLPLHTTGNTYHYEGERILPQELCMLIPSFPS